MTKNRGLKRRIHTPQTLQQDDRRTDTEIVPHNRTVHMQKILQLQPEIFFLFADIYQNHNKLDDARSQRADCRTPRAQSRHTEASVNQHPVDTEIDGQRAQRQIKRNSDHFRTAQNRQQNGGHTEKRISKAYNLQIAHALRDNGAVLREQSDYLLREYGNHHKQCRHQYQRRAHRYTRKAPD